MPKQLEARVISSYNAGAVQAFSGREYIRTEWRLVPPGFEDEAKQNQLLETRPYVEGAAVELIMPDVSQRSGIGKEPEPAVDASLEETGVEPESISDETGIEQPTEKKSRRSRSKSEG